MQDQGQPVIRSIRDLGTGASIPPAPASPRTTPPRAASPDSREDLIHAERVIAEQQQALLAAETRQAALEARIRALEEEIRSLRREAGIEPGGLRDAL